MWRHALCTAGFALGLCASKAAADDRPGAFSGPFTSQRLFTLPTADVVGAYEASLSSDASLLTEPDLLSLTSIAAIGFGDVAQLEFRSMKALEEGRRVNIVVPAVGVQAIVPLKTRKYVPRFGAALRIGIPQDIERDGIAFTHRVTDGYLVASLRLWGALRAMQLHAGLRIAEVRVDEEQGTTRALRWLPAFGLDLAATPTTRFAAELVATPNVRFRDDRAATSIGTGLLFRAGVRWNLASWLVLDTSVGAGLEVARRRSVAGGTQDLLTWDIRLGGEIFLPWGKLACRSLHVFCTKGSGQ